MVKRKEVGIQKEMNYRDGREQDQDCLDWDVKERVKASVMII